MSAILTPTGNQSLFEIEERLDMLFNSEEFIDPDAADAPRLRQRLAAEIADAIQAELSKVDGIANYITWLEQQQAYANAEIARLKTRRAQFERRQQRIEEMVIQVLDARGKKRLEGHTTFLALHRCPASLAILDEQEIPLEYKTTVITSEITIEKDRIKKVLKAAIPVPGCRLTAGKQRLVHG
jgi:DNA-binding transcriptional regulator YbjK